MPVDEFARLKAGMSKADVLELLGPPDDLGLRLNGSVFVYRYRDDDEAMLYVAYSQASSDITLTDRRTQRLVVFFDKRGAVMAFGRNQ